jgi:hypothetical protein
VVADGAAITVVAGEAFVVGRQGAGPRGRITGCDLADCVGASGRLGTGHNRSLIDPALIGQRVGVAHQGPGTEVTIFKGLAICVVLAGAVDPDSGATASTTFVSYSARIAVVAISHVVQVLATSQPVAAIVGARVGVITGDEASRANSLFTVVAHSANVAILALAYTQRHVLTTFLAEAGIFGAIVIIVTALFVDVAVAVVVDSVASFGRGLGSIT